MKTLKQIIFIFITLALVNCAGIKTLTGPKEPEKIRIKTPLTLKIKPGEVISFKVPGKATDAIYCENSKAKSFYVNGYLNIIVSESYFTKFLPRKCFYKGDNHLAATLTVLSKDFPTERLRVDKKRVFPNKKHIARIQREQKFLNKNYNSSPSLPLFSDSFVLPIDSKVTSIYGSRRLFNGKKQTQHLGTDYRAAVGTIIKSANAGKVVVSRDLFYTGNTVTIDHGLNIFTIYGHLSKLYVKEGDYIPKGHVIGLAGRTGRVTGPHLHWGVKVNGDFIEGDSLIKATRQSKFIILPGTKSRPGEGDNNEVILGANR